MTLPSSISAPSTLVPITRAVSGSTTDSPKVPRNSAGQTGLTATSLSVTVISRSTIGTSVKTSARFRPRVARSVIRRTTGLSRAAILLTISGRHQVGEHALQRLVRRQHLTQPDPAITAQPGELPREFSEVGGPDLKPTRRYLDAGDRRASDQRRAERAVRRRPHQEHMRPARHQPANRPEVAGSREPPAHDHLDRA